MLLYGTLRLGKSIGTWTATKHMLLAATQGDPRKGKSNTETIEFLTTGYRRRQHSQQYLPRCGVSVTVAL